MIQTRSTSKILKELAPVYCCLACGFIMPSPVWGEDGQSPDYSICPCCSIEEGYEDSSVEGVMNWRFRWSKFFFAWAQPEKKPENWDFAKQLSNIPPQFITKEEVALMLKIYDPIKASGFELSSFNVGNGDSILFTDNLLNKPIN